MKTEKLFVLVKCPNCDYSAHNHIKALIGSGRVPENEIYCPKCKKNFKAFATINIECEKL